jgi:hypothetical protein
MTAEGACSYLRSAHVHGAAPAATARAKPPRAPARLSHAAGHEQAAVPTQSVPLQPAKSAKARPASASTSRTLVNSNKAGRPASAGADRPPLYYKPVASIDHDAEVMASVLAYIAAIPMVATTESSNNSSSLTSLQCAPEPTPEPVARCSFAASMSCIAEEEASRAATASHSDSQSAAITAAAAARRHSSAATAGATTAAITPLALDAFTAYRPSLDDATAALDVRGGSVVAAIAAARRTEGQALQRRRRRSAAASAAAAAVAAAGSTASSSSTSSSGILAEQLAGANASEHVSTT